MLTFWIPLNIRVFWSFPCISVLDVQDFSYNESRVEFLVMAHKVNEFSAEEGLLCSLV